MKICIIDDNEEIIECITLILEYELPNAYFFTASNVIDGIKILRENEIHVCISDHSLPNGNGSDVLNFIIENDLNTKFVLCSGMIHFDDDMDTYPSDRVSLFIPKPDIVGGLRSIKNILKK